MECVVMKKMLEKRWGKALLIVLAIGVIGSLFSTEPSTNDVSNIKRDVVQEEKKIEVCDGTSITRDCSVDGVEYSVYKYYPAEPERSHVETITTYTKEIVGYCTLCNDGTRSPSCATGRGACSHHGGVAEWNAPIYSDVPHYEYVTVIDAEAIPERWEKIEK